VAPAATAAVPAPNHPFARVAECSRDYAETDWCDAAHRAAIEAAIASRRADFAGHHVLLVVPDAAQPGRVAIAAIDARTGVVHPLPVDSIGGDVDDRGFDLPGARPRIDYDLASARVCLSGSLYEYRNTVTNTTACFELGADGFQPVR
jgi:hypothetical protein